MAKKKRYRYVLYLGIRGLAGLFYLVPRRMALALIRFFARLGYGLIGRQRNHVLDNLRRVYGREKTEAEMRALGRQVFENITQTSVELLQFPKLAGKDVRDFVDVGNAPQVYRSLLDEGKGLISITAHLGNWELLAGTFAMMGFSGAVVARRVYYERYNQWILGLRQSLNISTIYREHAIQEILDILRDNRIVGMLPDQDIASQQGVFVDFFGREAYTPIAPVRIALLSGAPILVNFLIRERDDRYRVVVGDVIRPVVETTREEAYLKYTRDWMRQFEAMIRRYPEQWVWMHRRWKTRPETIQDKRSRRFASKRKATLVHP